MHRIYLPRQIVGVVYLKEMCGKGRKATWSGTGRLVLVSVALQLCPLEPSWAAENTNMGTPRVTDAEHS